MDIPESKASRMLLVLLVAEEMGDRGDDVDSAPSHSSELLTFCEGQRWAGLHIWYVPILRPGISFISAVLLGIAHRNRGASHEQARGRCPVGPVTQQSRTFLDGLHPESRFQ